MPEITQTITASIQIGFGAGLVAGFIFFFSVWGGATVLKIFYHI